MSPLPVTKRQPGQAVRSSANAFGFFQIFWVFTICSVVGVVVETIFCLIFKGQLECRQGVLYGPFNQVYGFGAVILMYVSHYVKDKGKAAVFLTCALAGGFFEAVCSYVQQMVFGTVSWDYNWMPFALMGGRTNLLYMIFFGVLGLVFVYLLLPPLMKLSDRISTGRGLALTRVFLVFLILDLALSAIAVDRWVERQRGAPPSSSMERLVDRYYPDDTLEIIYPSMVMPNTLSSTQAGNGAA